MLRNANVLLVTWDGAGNLPPERALVRALIARGHRVHALAHDSVRDLLEGDGAECLPLQGVRDYDSRQPMAPNEELPFVIEHIWLAPGYGSALLAAVEHIRPQLLLIDFNLMYAFVAAQRLRLPTVALCHFPYHLVVPFSPLLDAHLDTTNAYARALGVGPFTSHQALVEASNLVLVASYLPFEPTGAFASNLVHVGPLRSLSAGANAWKRRTPDRPFVLVSLSTSHQNQVPLLQRICDALGTLQVEALVTTGRSIAPDLINSADNTTVVPAASHDDILPSADLLITHAGHGTAMAGITYGVPMLCVPMGRDQPMIADRVAQLGIGSVIVQDATVADIQRAVTALLSDARVKQRSTQFAESLVGHPGLDHALRLVESLE